MSLQKEIKKVINIYANKKIYIFFSLLMLTFVGVYAQEDVEIDGIESDVYLNIVGGIIKVGSPQIIDKYVLFTANATSRHVAIAFEHEKYAKLHSFRRLVPDEEAGSVLLEPVLFYIMELPEKMSMLRYRLIIDGLWTHDPENTMEEFDSTNRITVSKLIFPPRRDIKTRVIGEKMVNFVYVGEPGKKISVAGSFNNWDPFMYFMEETSSGIYEINLPLPHGTHIYSYFLGTNMYADNTNPEHYYDEEGRMASVIKL